MIAAALNPEPTFWSGLFFGLSLLAVGAWCWGGVLWLQHRHEADIMGSETEQEQTEETK